MSDCCEDLILWSKNIFNIHLLSLLQAALIMDFIIVCTFFRFFNSLFYKSLMFCESESSSNVGTMEDWNKILIGPAEIIKGALFIDQEFEYI